MMATYEGFFEDGKHNSRWKYDRLFVEWNGFSEWTFYDVDFSEFRLSTVCTNKPSNAVQIAFACDIPIWMNGIDDKAIEEGLKNHEAGTPLVLETKERFPVYVNGDCRAEHRAKSVTLKYRGKPRAIPKPDLKASNKAASKVSGLKRKRADLAEEVLELDGKLFDAGREWDQAKRKAWLACFTKKISSG